MQSHSCKAKLKQGENFDSPDYHDQHSSKEEEIDHYISIKKRLNTHFSEQPWGFWVQEGDKPLNQREKGTADEIKEGIERAAVS